MMTINDRLRKIRAADPDFDKKMTNIFEKKMPELMLMMIEGEDYSCHLGTKEVAEMAEEYIRDQKGEHIGFHWDYNSVINIAKTYIDFAEQDFYEGDMWVEANIVFGDYGHITPDPATLIKMAIERLTDQDYPWGDPSTRVYHWLKKHIELKEKK